MRLGLEKEVRALALLLGVLDRVLLVDARPIVVRITPKGNVE